LSAGFHEVDFPFAAAIGASGGPERRTEIAALASGGEARNALWSGSRRRWSVGAGLRSLADLDALLAFFEARRGPLHGFRFRDPLDHQSGPLGAEPAPLDQEIGIGDGAATQFQLCKTYESGGASWRREIAKPVAGSVRLALDGAALAEGVDFTLDPATGALDLVQPPGAGASLTAGFLFDCPARFERDRLVISLDAFKAGRAPELSLVEITP